MICASFAWERGRSGHLPVDGTQQLTDGMIQAVLDCNDVPEVHVFFDHDPEPARTLALQRYSAEKRLLSQHLALLPKLVEEHAYVAMSDETSVGRVGAVRDAVGHATFPLCCVIHTLREHDLIGWGASALLRSEPYDVMCVTSKAIGTALQRVMDAGAEWLYRKAVIRDRPRVERIPMCIDLDTFKPRNTAYCRDTLGLPRDRILVLFGSAADVEAWMDLESTLACIREVVAAHPETMLVVPSGEGQVGRLNELTRSMGITEHVQLITAVSAHAQPLLTAAADVFLSLDSRIGSGAELRILEAMASGVPVISLDWNGCREIVDDGATGVLVPTFWNPVAGAMMSWLGVGDLGDVFLAERTIIDQRALRQGLEMLLSQPERRASMGGAARAFVDKNHSVRLGGRRISELWRAQRSECDGCGGESRRSPLDYTQVFRHYATTDLDLDLMCCANASGRRLLGDALHGVDGRTFPPLLRKDAGRILGRASTPVSVHQCVERGSEFALEAVVWLLRKGYLDVLTYERQESRAG